MLIRQTYHTEKRDEIKSLILDIVNHLQSMTEHFEQYFKEPTKEAKEFILKNEKYVNKNEKKIEQYILEVFSLEQLNVHEIKWLLAMNRLIRELERTGDYLINIITLSNVVDTDILRPVIMEFFMYVKDMMQWLSEGIQQNDVNLLTKVVDHDRHINALNKEAYRDVASQLHDQKSVSEAELKSVVISRFLERVGDHLVNAAEEYLQTIQ